MNIAIIGRGPALYETCKKLIDTEHTVCCIITSKAAPEYSVTENEFKDLADFIEVPYMVSNKVDELDEFFSTNKPDIGISVNYTSIIPKRITKLFPLGILNAHGGDLPRYRGNACQAWALLNGESEIGLCIHKMVGDELDSGDIICREKLSVNIDTKIFDVIEWMDNLVPDMFLLAIDRLSVDPTYILDRQSDDIRKTLHCYPRRPSDARINWNKSSEEILRLINASGRPYPGAYTNYNGEKVYIHEASLPSNSEPFLAIPGQVTELENSSIIVACGEGKLRISLLDYNDKSIVPRELIKSRRDRLE